MKFSSITGLNPVASSFLLYGLVLLVLPIVGALSNFDFNVILIKPDVYVPAILAYTWILYGPSLVYYFEVKGLPELRAGLENIIPRKNIHQVDELINWFISNIHEKYKYMSIALVTIAFLDAIFMVDYAKLHFHVKDLFDPFYLTAVSMMLLIVFMSGIGFTAVYYNAELSRRLTKIKVVIDPFHPDEFGGMMAIGRFSIKITLLFSSGAVLLPFLIQASSFLGNMAFYISILAASLYILFVALSFFVPTYYFHTIACREKQRYLRMIRKRYMLLFKSMLNHQEKQEHPDNVNTNLSEVLEVFLLGECHRIIDEMKVYPFDIDIILQLLGSIALPVILTIFQVLISIQ